jgi:spermidine/putrescine transport system permease protein
MTARTNGVDVPAAAQRAARRRRRTPYLLLLPGMLWLTVFYLVPMAQLAITSLKSGTLMEGFVFSWEWGNYGEVLSSFGPHVLRSLLYAGLATLIALLIAYPLAYGIAFRGGKYKNLLLVLVLMPFLVSFVLRTYAWRIILSDNGAVVDFLKWAHLLPANGRLLATGSAVVAGITYNFLPFMTLPIYVSLEKIDRSLIEAANDLYANTRVAFRRVTWPLSLPGVVAGTLLTWIPAAGDFINATLLGTPNQAMIGNVIQNRFLVQVNYPLAAAASFALMLLILLLLIPYVRATGTEDLVA